jgi:hypothetical protein
MDTAERGVLAWLGWYTPSDAVKSGLSPARSRAVGSRAELIVIDMTEQAIFGLLVDIDAGVAGRCPIQSPNDWSHQMSSLSRAVQLERRLLPSDPVAAA